MEAGSGQEDGYKVPQVFGAAMDRGFAGFQVVPAAEDLLDPLCPEREVPPERYSHYTILNGRTPRAN